MLNFHTEIQSRDISIYDPPQVAGLENGSDYEITPDTFVVHWTCDIEARDWGIKEINCSVTSIVGSFEIAYMDENGDEARSEVIELNYDAFKNIAWEVENVGGCISPNSLDIDYKALSISIRG